jgi:hypothetical protein
VKGEGGVWGLGLEGKEWVYYVICNMWLLNQIWGCVCVSFSCRPSFVSLCI